MAIKGNNLTDDQAKSDAVDIGECQLFDKDIPKPPRPRPLRHRTGTWGAIRHIDRVNRFANLPVSRFVESLSPHLGPEHVMQIYEANANVFVVARNLFVVPEEAREVDHKWPDAIEVTASYSTSGSCSPT